ncbi:hypothetical protein KM043_007498 [Ampulex compressa]|nr:hypothetical protein KM043_007498 [Ampulex compressa]
MHVYCHFNQPEPSNDFDPPNHSSKITSQRLPRILSQQNQDLISRKQKPMHKRHCSVHLETSFNFDARIEMIKTGINFDPQFHHNEIKVLVVRGSCSRLFLETKATQAPIVYSSRSESRLRPTDRFDPGQGSRANGSSGSTKIDGILAT